MQQEQKTQIQKAAQDYMAAKQITPDNLAGLAGVNPTYLHHILSGTFAIPSSGGKTVVIKDQYFIKIAEVVGVEVRKVYWRNDVETVQYVEIMSGLVHAKTVSQTATTLICPTGMGKTNAVDQFVKQYPKHTYKLTVNSLIKVHDVINWLMDELKVEIKGNSKAAKFIAIVTKIREVKRAGGFPIIILDEMENAELPFIKFIKGLFDGMRLGDKRYGAIVQVGTSQLLRKMERLKNSNIDAGPQYYRRFKAGVNRISEKVNFEPFFEAMNVTDKGLRKLLGNICDNYGELNDYLEPALREADEQGVELNEELFRVIYNMAA